MRSSQKINLTNKYEFHSSGKLNTIYMIKEFIKSHSIMREFWLPLARLRARLRGVSELSANNYMNSVVGGTMVVAPTNIPGRFEVSAISHLAMRVAIHGDYERDVTTVLAKYPKQAGTFVNVGANVGFYSVYAAKVLGYSKVLAVEPNPSAFELLCRNISANGLDGVIVAHQKCVARTEGQLQLAVVDGMPEYSSIDRIVLTSVHQKEVRHVTVSAVPLMEIVGDERVGVLFVDTEGAEEEIFAGAEDILMRDRPLIYFECSDPLLRKFGSSSAALEHRLATLGYIVRNGLAPSLRLRHPYEGEAVAYHPQQPAHGVFHGRIPR